MKHLNERTRVLYVHKVERLLERLNEKRDKRESRTKEKSIWRNKEEEKDDDAVTQAEAAIEAKLRKGFLIPKK